MRASASRFSTGNPGDTAMMREIVGVVSDVREDALTEGVPTVYVSAEQTQLFGSAFVVRTTGDASAFLPLIKDVVHTLDPRVALLAPRTMSDVLSNLVRRQNVAMMLIGMFALLALLLAGLGVYGVMAYSVASRTREFGIRTALGASRVSILTLVLRNGLATTLLGLVAGCLLAAGLSRFATSLLVGVRSHDPVSFVAAVALLAIVAIAACLVPARAAMRVQPVEALRLE